MQKSSRFEDVLEATERLTLEEREALADVLKRRTVAERRAKLKQGVTSARRETASKKIKPASARKIVQDILG